MGASPWGFKSLLAHLTRWFAKRSLTGQSRHRSMIRGMGDDEFERERDEYFERVKGGPVTPMGDFSNSNYAPGELAQWHPAMVAPTRSERRRSSPVSLWWLVGAVVIVGLILGLLMARSMG